MTTSSDKATTGIDFNFTCDYHPFDDFVIITRDNLRECSFRSHCRRYHYNENYTCTCSYFTITLTLPGSFDIDTLHGSQWMCEDYYYGRRSNRVLLYVNGKYEYDRDTLICQSILCSDKKFK